MIDISRAESIQGWCSDVELRWLSETARRYDTIVEVGSWRGRSTVALALNVQNLLVTIDTFAGSKDPRNGHYDGGHQEALEQNGDKIYSDFMRNTWDLQSIGKLKSFRCRSDSGAALVRDLVGQVPFIFLDGAHDPDGVKNDIKAYLPLVRSGGFLSGHDWFWPELSLAVRSLLPGAKVAVDSIWMVTVP